MTATDDSARGHRRADGKYVIAKTSDIAEGDRLIVNVGGRSVGIFKVDGNLYAFLNHCPHRGGALCRGPIVSGLESLQPGEFVLDKTKKYIACPWHGWEFDLVTGQSWFDPQTTRARPYQVQVESGKDVSAQVAAGDALQRDEAGAQFRTDQVTHRLRGPYQATTVPLTVDDDYIVLDLVPRRRGTPQAAKPGEASAINK